jgi:hypothetical protein
MVQVYKGAAQMRHLADAIREAAESLRDRSERRERMELANELRRLADMQELREMDLLRPN